MRLILFPYLKRAKRVKKSFEGVFFRRIIYPPKFKVAIHEFAELITKLAFHEYILDINELLLHE